MREARAGCPYFSIIVPTHDRLDSLARCLGAIAALDYPRDRYEAIVVDDGGARSPADIVDRYSASVRLSLITQPHAGPAAARNAGVAKSEGDALAFTDDDCAADSNWLSALAARLQATPRAVIGGRVANALQRNPYARASQGLIGYLYRYYHEEHLGTLPFFSTNNIAVHRREFDAIGPFDSTFPFASEDRDWCDRGLLLGHELVYAPEALVYHSHDLTFRTFLRQHFRYGQGALRFHRTRARRRRERVHVESLSFYTRMLTEPFAAGEPHPVRTSLLMMTSQAVAAVGFAFELSKGRAQAGQDEAG